MGYSSNNRIRKTTDVSVSYRSDSLTQDGGDDENDYELATRKDSQTQLRPVQLEVSQEESRRQPLPSRDARNYREKW